MTGDGGPRTGVRLTQVEPSTQRSQGTQSDGAGREAVYAGYPRAYKLINEAYSHRRHESLKRGLS